MQDEVAGEVAEALADEGEKIEFFGGPGLAGEEFWGDVSDGEGTAEDEAVAGSDVADVLDETVV